jgi:8-oxo-dGTP pyrophosphatase MutT (NUDIX family)
MTVHSPQNSEYRAATAVLGRDGPGGLEVLLLERASTTSFAAGAWVVPGGRVEDSDVGGDSPHGLVAARRAAVRETEEETGLRIGGAELVELSHWTPGPEAPKRYLTWILLGLAPSGDVSVDGGEIVGYRWVAPAAALAEHRHGRLDLLPPTWMTLHQLSGYATYVDPATAVAAIPVPHFTSQLAEADGVRVILWEGAAGYDTGTASSAGGCHRLYLDPSGWRFESTL